jgi:hypothetical protein
MNHENPTAMSTTTEAAQAALAFNSPRAIRRLTRAHECEIAPGEPDIRGWLVIAADGYRVGRVCDLLVDLVTLRLGYLEIQLDPRIAGEPGRRTVVPIGCLRLSAQRNYVHVCDVFSDEFADAPRLGARPVGPLEELVLRRFFGCEPPSGSPLGEVARARRLAREADRFWGLRRQARGAAPYFRRVPEA